MSAEGQFTKFDARLQTPFSLIIAGPSSCGKTSFVINLLKNNRRVVSNPFDYILWFYGESFPRDEYFQNQPITFHQGLPDSFDSLINPSKRGLAIFDDLMAECGNSKLITEFFTKRTHHENVSVIFITQNLYSEGKERKNFAKNATYLCVFNSPLDQTVGFSLARSLMPHNHRCFVNIFSHAVTKAHGYLFIDGHQESPKAAMFRSDMFGDVQHVYIPLKPSK